MTSKIARFSRPLILSLLMSLHGLPASDLGYISVKDCGAAGDGKADDTEAIRKAFEIAAKSRKAIPRGPLSPSEIGSSPTVFFPSGIYLVTDEIAVSGTEMSVLGDPWVIVRQENPESDIFVSTSAWRMLIKGISFVGGRSQLVLRNEDIDSGTIEIETCNFLGSKGPSLIVNTESTNLVVERCKFLAGNQGALLDRVDMAVFRDCWFYSSREMKDKAFIENRAQRSLFENICGVPLVSGFADRWIDNYATNLIVRDFRFGGEYGGMTPVVNFAKARSSGTASSIVIEDSWACSSGSEMRNTIVYLEEIPNRIELRGNSVRAASLVQLRPDLDLATYFVSQKVRPSMLSFIAEGNVGEAIDPKLPKLLADPVAGESLPFPDVAVDVKEDLVVAALKKWRAAESAEAEGPFQVEDHVQVTDKGRIREVMPGTSRWILSDPMDSTLVPSDFFLSVAEEGDDTLWVWNQYAGAVWPHVRIADLTVDLDETPWLTWKCKKSGSAPEHLVMKVRVPAKEISVILANTQFKRFDYFAFDLKKRLGLSGKQQLELKIYPAVFDMVGDKKGSHNRQGTTWRPDKGMFGVIDFIRFEPDK